MQILEKRVHSEVNGAYGELMDAFRRLLVNKEFEKISVAEISKAANVSRKTFYNYFRDKNELVEHIVYKNILLPMKQMRSFSDAFQFPSQTIMSGLYEKFYEDRVFYKKVSLFTGQNSFFELMMDYTTVIVEEKFRDLAISEQEKEYSIYFYASSHMMVLMKWIRDGMVITPQQMATFYDKWTIPAIVEYMNEKGNTL